MNGSVAAGTRMNPPGIPSTEYGVLELRRYLEGIYSRSPGAGVLNSFRRSGSLFLLPSIRIELRILDFC